MLQCPCTTAKTSLTVISPVQALRAVHSHVSRFGISLRFSINQSFLVKKWKDESKP